MYIDILEHYNFTNKFKSLSNEEKKALGFFIHDDGSCSFNRFFNFTLPEDEKFELSFDLSLDKDDKANYCILDENFGQPICCDLKDGTQYKYDVETQTKQIIEDLINKEIIEKIEDYEEPIITPVNNLEEKEITNKEVFWYESHMGGIYHTSTEQDYEDLSCDECGDSDWPLGRSRNKEEAYKLLLNNYQDKEIETKYRIKIYDIELKTYYWYSHSADYPKCIEDNLMEIIDLADEFDTKEEAEKELSLFKNNNRYETEIEPYEFQFCSYEEDYLRELAKEAYTENYKRLQPIKNRMENYSFNILSDKQMKEAGYNKFGHNWERSEVIDLQNGICYKSIICEDAHNVLHYEYIVKVTGDIIKIIRDEVQAEDAIKINNFLKGELNRLVKVGVIK